MIVIIDHGQGNIGSLKNSLSQLNINFKVCSNFESFSWEEEIRGFILPGVGSFDKCMIEMRRRKLDKLIDIAKDAGALGAKLTGGGGGGNMVALAETKSEQKKIYKAITEAGYRAYQTSFGEE